MKDFYDTPDRIGIFGDWHGSFLYGQFAIEEAAKRGVDVMLHTGDFGWTFRDQFLDELEKSLSKHNIYLGFILGNHEDYKYVAQLKELVGQDFREHIHLIDRGDRWTWGDTRFLGIGGAHSVDRDVRTKDRDWWEEETITLADAIRIIDEGTTDVIISHDVPTGVTVPGIAGNPFGFNPREIAIADVHRNILRVIVDYTKPAYLAHGHYHRRYTDVFHGEGYDTVIYGLDCNGTPIDYNMVVFNLEDLNNRN